MAPTPDQPKSKTPTPNQHKTKTRQTTKTCQTSKTPIELPDPMTPESLADHIRSLANDIDKALKKSNSVRVQDKEEINTLTKAIVDATSFITKVMDAETSVSNISATDLISSVKEEIKQELKIFKEEMTQQFTEKPKTYASMAAKTTKNIKTPVSRPGIIVYSEDPNKTHKDVMETWTEKVSFKDATFAPARVIPVSKNKWKVEFDNVQQKDETLKKVKKVKDLKAEDAKRRRPMLILKGINKSVKREEIVDLIGRQNPSVTKASEQDMRLCFLRNNKNENLFNAIIEVTPQIRNSLLELRRVSIDHQRVHVSDFSPFVQCYKCLQFGHTKAHCGADVFPCSHCASTEHTFKDCDVSENASKLRCYNCHKHNVDNEGSIDDAHSATSTKNCPRVKAIMKRINERVDYGC